MRDENVDAQRQEHTDAGDSANDMHAALFAQLVMQQANMAMMLMGRVPNPQSGESLKDLEAARLFVDTVEMLEVKTKGNLSREESGLLKQTLMTLRMAYVEAVNEPGNEKPAGGTQSSEAANPQPAVTHSDNPSVSTSDNASTAAEEEHRKKFSKKY